MQSKQVFVLLCMTCLELGAVDRNRQKGQAMGLRQASNNKNTRAGADLDPTKRVLVLPEFPSDIFLPYQHQLTSRRKVD